MQKNIQKKFFAFEIIAFEFVARNCLCLADNASHRRSMARQTVLGFCVSLKHTFSKGTTFTVINKFCKGAAIQIGTLFRPICCVLCLRVL